MNFIEQVSELIDKRYQDSSLPYRLRQDPDYPSYYDASDHGLQLRVRDGVVESVFFFLDEESARGNDMISKPWRTETGLHRQCSRDVVRSILGDPIDTSQLEQKGRDNGYTACSDLFESAWGTTHVSYTANLESIAAVVCTGRTVAESA